MVASAGVAMLTGSAGAVISGSHVYAGGSRKAARYMDIELQVLAGGSRANWRLDVYGPCTEHERLGRSIGTDVGNTPPDPQLRIHHGRFSLRRRGHSINGLPPLTYSYQLAGHAIRGGFAGTLHYHEGHGAYQCDSHILHWRAHRTRGTFP
jgi:hypothetical protein